jgi:hypothetical protein
LLGAHVGAAAVELFVAGDQVRAFLLEPGEEDLLDLVAEVEGHAAQEGCFGFAGAVDDGLDLLGAVVYAGHQGSDEDTRVDAAAAQLGDGVEAGPRARRVGLGGTPSVLVEGGN